MDKVKNIVKNINAFWTTERVQTTLNIVLIAFYFIISLFLLDKYQYQINPDGISYISIAQKCIKGDFYNAVSSHWGPLISWFTIPFLLLKISPIIAIKTVLLIAGFVTLIGLKNIAKEFNLSNKLTFFILITSMFYITFYASSVITPDILLTCFLMLYLSIIFKQDYLESKYYGILCGVFGGLAYLSKAFGLPFFILHFVLFSLISYLRAKESEYKRKALKNFFLGMLTFILLSGIWVSAISIKYKELTFGSSGKTAYQLFSPQQKGNYPMFYVGLLPPSDKNAYSVWDDPTLLNMKNWNSLDSKKSVEYEKNLLVKNIRTMFTIYKSFSNFFLVIVFLSIILFIRDLFKKKKINYQILYCLITFILYSLGYIQFPVEARHLAFNNLLLIIMGFLLLSNIFAQTRTFVVPTYFLSIILSLSFIKSPLQEVINYGNTTNPDYYCYSIAQMFKKHNIKGNIASSSEWNGSYYVVYHLNSKYYGIPQKSPKERELIQELIKNNINYYIVWNNEQDEYSLKSLKKVSIPEIPFINVYNVTRNLDRKK